MKSYFDIYDVKMPQENDDMVKSLKKFLFNSDFSFYFKLLEINGTEKCDGVLNLSLN